MLRHQEGEHVAHPPVGKVSHGAQVQSLDSMNSGLNNNVSSSGQLKRSAVFELATREETEADREIALQIWRRKRRLEKEKNMSSATLDGKGEEEKKDVVKTSKVAKRKIEESEDNADCSEEVEKVLDVQREVSEVKSFKRHGKGFKGSNMAMRSFVFNNEEGNFEEVEKGENEFNGAKISKGGSEKKSEGGIKIKGRQPVRTYGVAKSVAEESEESADGEEEEENMMAGSEEEEEHMIAGSDDDKYVPSGTRAPKKKKKVKKLVRKSAEGPFVLDDAAIDVKYAKNPEHAARIKNLPRREKEIFLYVEGRICGSKNPKFLSSLHSSNDAEETIKAFQLTAENYEEVVGEKFEPIKGVSTSVAPGGRGTDTIEDAFSNARSDSWVEGITYVYNLLLDFVYTTKEFRNIDWVSAEAADLDLVLGYFFLWAAPQQGSNSLGKSYVPRTLKNIKTKLQKMLEYFLKRKDFNLSSADALFSKSMYEAKQNLTAKRAGGPGEGVQGDRERKAFTPADRKKIDEWVLKQVMLSCHFSSGLSHKMLTLMLNIWWFVWKAFCFEY